MLTYLSEQIVSSEGRMPAFTAKVAFLMVLLVTARSAGAQELNTRESDATVKETVQRLEAAIEERGATVVATVDHAANATSVDIVIPAADPPPLKWSALEYGFESLKEDGHGKTPQARRDRREAAAG